ncbi:MAG: tetratricopeptide repeat protein [Pseudomonadota bacterium]
MRLLRTLLTAASALIVVSCAVAPEPDSAVGAFLSARLAANENALEDAAAAYAETHSEAPGERSILGRAFFFQLASGNVAKANAFAERLVAFENGDPDGLANLTLAVFAADAGDYETARSRIAAMSSNATLKPAAALIDVWIEDGLSGPRAAIEKLRNPPEGVFRGFNPLHNAFLAEKAGDLDAARAAAQVALLGFAGPVGREAYGAILERIGDKEAATEYYGLLRRDGGAGRRIAEAGGARIARGSASAAFANVSPEEGMAIALFTFAAAVIDQTVDERTRAEEAGYIVGAPRYNIPLALSQLALFLDPNLQYARSLTGRIYNVYGDYANAEAALGAIPPSSPLFEDARIEIARGQAAREENNRAISTLKNTIARDKRAIDARLTLSNLYSIEDRHEDAVAVLDALVADYEAAPELTPAEDAWRLYIARGGSLLELDQWTRAEADLKRAVEIAPEEPDALNYLGYSWAERGENLTEAFELIEKAVALRPDSGAIIDSLGWAHYQLGNYDEAVVHLEDAAAKEPADPTITDHLGDVYWKLGRKIEARYQWRHVLDLDPDDDLKESVEGKLASGLPQADKDAK